MKHLSILVALSLLPLSAYAGGGSHGGDVIMTMSTAAQVRRAIELSRQHMAYFFGKWMSADKIKDRELKEVLDRFYKNMDLSVNQTFDSSDLTRELAETPIRAIDGECLDSDGQGKDASVEAHRLRSPICFSVPRLRRLDGHILQAQIDALLAHEAAHQFGFGERVAVKVQKYFLSGIITIGGNSYTPYVGNNVRIITRPDKLSIIEVYGEDARALYDSMEGVKPVKSELGWGQGWEPPAWIKNGKHLSCARFIQPIDPNSSYATYFASEHLVDIRPWDYACNVGFRPNGDSLEN